MKTKYNALILLALIANLCFTQILWATARFSKLGVEEGLPSRAVWDIQQDSNGVIWLATTYGLASISGTEVTLYEGGANQPELNAEDRYKSLLITENDQIWIGTYLSGLKSFNRETQNFSYFSHSAAKSDTISSNNINDLEEATNGDIWLATTEGLDRFSVEKQTAKRYKHDSLDSSSIPSNWVSTLLAISNGDLWIGTRKGLSIYKESKRQFENRLLPTTTQPSIRAFLELSNGNLLIGTEKGLFHYDNKTNKFVLVQGIPNNGILSLTHDQDQNTWVGTRHNGVFLLKNGEILENKSRTNFQYDRGTQYSLSDKTILSLFSDYAGIVWIGTFSAGLNWIDPRSLKFGFQDNSLNGINCLPSPQVYSSLFTDKGDTWIGTREGAVLIKADGSCHLHQYVDASKNSISDNEVFKILNDKNGRIWLGTAKGIDRYNPNTNTFSPIKGELEKQNVYDILEIGSDEYLISTTNKFYLFTESDNYLKEIHTQSTNKDTTIFGKITNFGNNKYLIASSQGLLEYNYQSNELKHLTKNGTPLITKYVRVLYRDIDGNIWVGLNGVGLVKISNSLNINTYNRENGFPNVRAFSGILEDEKGNLWISADQSIIKFSPSTLNSEIYYTNDGLLGNTYSRRTANKTPDGRLVFGGSNGINIFNPSEIVKNVHSPKVSITKFYYFGEEYSLTNKPEDFSLSSPLSQLEELKLTYKDYNFGFEFSALHFSDYSRNQYAYMMDGFDPHWLYTDSSNRKVNYTNLPAGNYTFKVKAANKDGIWNETPKELKITISPAPWKTWWAYTIYAFTLFLSLLYFIKKRTQILEERAQQLENTVEQRTKELSQEKRKVEQLLSKKNEEFANVSHEFRTPLTLVLGPVAQLIEKANDEASINKLNIIQRNGYRLLRMVDQLLNIETFRIKTIAKKSPQAIGKSTKLMCEAFADLADAKGMKLSFSGEESINFEFTQDAYEKILLNLLSNAIKYSKTGAQISVTTLRTDNNEYHLSVSDTGIGIPADKIDSVFERYNRVMDENSEQVTGAGIGLALVNELVKAHQGRIKLQSQIGEGTCIDIYLPIINEVSDEQVATSSNADLIDLELVSLSNQKAGDANHSETEDESAVKESTVLVIEDNTDMRQYITNSLQDQYRVLTANNGKAGVELAIAEVPDVIVSDIMMPVMDGYEATKAIRDNEITSHIPLVLLTARGDRESRLRGWNEKADEYLTKPFDVEELRIRLANLLEIRNLLKKKFAETIFVEDTALEPPKEVEDQTDIYANKQKQQQIFIDKLNSFLNDHYSDTELAIPQISKGILMSERQFFRKLKSILDLSPVEYLRRYRLQKGKELLGQGLSTNRTAFDVGFSSQGYFGRCFKAQYGVSPSEYKKQLQSKA